MPADNPCGIIRAPSPAFSAKVKEVLTDLVTGLEWEEGELEKMRSVQEHGDAHPEIEHMIADQEYRVALAENDVRDILIAVHRHAPEILM